MRKFIKLLIGIGLIPMCAAVSLAVYRLYQDSLEIGMGNDLEALALPAGFLLWTLVFFILPRPFRTYVLGHELTHALWALMMGGRIGKMKVSRNGGHVELSKTNFVITLAPYFFPFYTFLVIAAYYLAGLTFEVEAYRVWWLAGVGLTWSFHITFTIHMLSEHQPDVQEHGRLFSYTIIYMMNVLVIGLWMVMVGPPRIATLGSMLVPEIATAYAFAWQQIIVCREFVAELFQEKAPPETVK
ncbi:MAG: hypothetical protein HKP10_09470 [Kiritimatiellales bacterium]|nr:hypothetical protein [Pontiella sp.]NNJ71498.1 hypothetical protein [Kiritimatiellales bacterium]